MMVDISVIMPVLNGKKYISKAIESLLRQTLKSIELLVVDAGSTDGTQEIVKQFQLNDSRVKLIHSGKKSMGYQYNMGMDIAQGKYIGFLEADDCIYTDDILEKMFVLSEENELDYLKANFKMFVGRGTRKILLSVEQAKHILEERALYNCVISPEKIPELLFYDVNHWKGIYRASFIKDRYILFNETPGAAFQDMGFVFQTLLYAEKSMYIKDYYYCYRRDNNEASTFSSKGLVFAYDESVYILSKLSAAVNISCVRMIYKRLFYTLFSEINKLNYTDITKEVLEIISKYVYLIMEGEKKDFLCIDEIETHLWMAYKKVCENPVMYLEDSYNARRGLGESYHSFLEKIALSNGIVVCGYGKRGKMLEAFLQVNGIDKVICFCDNDKNKCGMLTECGYEIVSVEEAVKQYKLSHFLISLEGQWGQDLKSQLLNQDCKEENITIFSAYIDPYVATTKYL